MPGYTIEGKIGKLSAFGLDLKFENYFNSYVNTFYNFYDGQNDSYPIDLKIFEISAGIFAALKINDKICIEPNLNFLYVSHQECLSISKIDYNYYDDFFLINTEKIGLTSTLKADFFYNDKIEIVGKLKVIYWPRYFDYFITPNLNYSISHSLKGIIGIEYSPINKSIKPIIGVQKSFPN
jgi:hypothetical protein